jgi:3-phenylpropionate/cinnamic acid dioxygenase small subunit
MTDAAIQIANLLYRYAETIDSGDFEGAAALFAHAGVKMGDAEVGGAELLDVWRSAIILYDGVPRTKHVITNPIIEVDEAAGLASCRSYYTVMQQVGDTPLQPVICGRYHDSFERVDGVWRFCYRNYSLTDLLGDLSRHSRFWHLREDAKL